jgi:hypothetical protein
VGAVPLVAGGRRLVPDAGAADGGVAVELVLLAWELRAGTVRGPGEFGSRLALAWRRADRGAAEFSPPPINPGLARRLEQAAPNALASRRATP